MKRLNNIDINKIYQGDCIEILKGFPDGFINSCITSPPYWGLRDYGVAGQIGNEETPDEYVSKMVNLFREVKRVLKDDGTLWLNLGDSYAGSCSQSNDGRSGFGKPRERIVNRGKNRDTTKWSYSKCQANGDIKTKDLVGIPWMVAFALRADGWFLRQDIIWHKPNPMPESVTDRCTKSHEYIFLLSKSPKYYYDANVIREVAVWDIDGEGTIMRKERQKEGLKSNPDKMKNGIRITYPNAKHKDGQQSPKFINGFRNKRSVWTVTTKPFSQAHFATFPEELILPCVLASCPSGGTILDPFMGAGTTALVAKKNGCNFIGCELNPEYIEIANKRIAQDYLF